MSTQLHQPTLVDQLFFNGSVDFEPEEVVPGLTIRIRSLTIQEEIECAEAAAQAHSVQGREYLFIAHRLARAVRTVNGERLGVDGPGRDDLKARLRRDPTSVEEAVEFLLRRISRPAIYELYRVMTEHDKEIERLVEEVKKKPEAIPGGDLTSD